MEKAPDTPPEGTIRKETSVGRDPVFELVAIAILGPMICALLWALAYVASREALTRLRAFFLNFLARFKKKLNKTTGNRITKVRARKGCRYPSRGDDPGGMRSPENAFLQAMKT
jgi:hypothetical protein